LLYCTPPAAAIVKKKGALHDLMLYLAGYKLKTLFKKLSRALLHHFMPSVFGNSSVICT